jgi:hypothetical protein
MRSRLFRISHARIVKTRGFLPDISELAFYWIRKAKIKKGKGVLRVFVDGAKAFS